MLCHHYIATIYGVCKQIDLVGSVGGLVEVISDCRTFAQGPTPRLKYIGPGTLQAMKFKCHDFSRFTIVHILLHLGVDVFYFDMDTRNPEFGFCIAAANDFAPRIFLRNPLPEVLSQARSYQVGSLGQKDPHEHFVHQ